MYLLTAYIFYPEETAALQCWTKWYKQNTAIINIYFKCFKIFHLKKTKFYLL